MFADDVSSTAKTVLNLQRQLYNNDEFCQKTRIHLNLDKAWFRVGKTGPREIQF